MRFDEQQATIYMKRALELAGRAAGWTSPNPLVGAVIVKEGQIIGEGYHHRAGQPHAEVEALRAAGVAAKGSTIFVTLEPCNHFGRTPPCSHALVDAGVETVYYATRDPNQKASGGHQYLVDAGIDVIEGVCRDEARELNRFFFHAMKTKRPYVIAKYAASLDGKIATHTGDSQWITGPDARLRGHQLRQAADAILVGAGTVIADDPSLTVRLPEIEPCHPLRVVLDSHGRIPLTAKIFQPDLAGETVVATTAQFSLEREAVLNKQGVAVWRLPNDANGRVSLPDLLDRLGADRKQSLMVEGGGAIHGAFLDAGLIDEVWAFLAPVVIGGRDAFGPIGGVGPARLADALRLDHTRLEQVGSDWLIRGRVTGVDQ